MKVIFVGDSRRMKGGISTVMKTIESSWIWDKYHCYWLETQVNSNKFVKLLYIVLAWVKALYIIPQYDVVYFQTLPGIAMRLLFPIHLYAQMWEKRIIVELHVGNQIKDYVDDSMFQYWAKHSERFVFLGRTWEEKTKPKLPDTLKTSFLYNPVKIQTKQTNFKKYFLYAAYFNENKGCDVFLHAFAKIARSNPDFSVVMCGTGVETYMKSILSESAIAKLVDDKRIVFPGWIQGKKKDEYFKEAFAYCMTSYKEGLPMSVLESIANGVPVISTPVGCLPEILTDKESVLFFEFGNVDKLANAMNTLVVDNSLRTKISDNAYSLASRLFDVVPVCNKLESIILSNL